MGCISSRLWTVASGLVLTLSAGTAFAQQGTAPREPRVLGATQLARAEAEGDSLARAYHHLALARRARDFEDRARATAEMNAALECAMEARDSALECGDTARACALVAELPYSPALIEPLLRDARVAGAPRARLLGLRADHASDSGRADDAVRDYTAALACSTDAELCNLRRVWHGCLGLLLHDQALYTRAIAETTASLDLALLLGDANGIGNALNSLSNHANALDDDELAVVALTVALEYAKPGSWEEAQSLLSLASSEIKLEQLASARTHLERVLAIAAASTEFEPLDIVELRLSARLNLVETHDSHTGGRARETELAAVEAVLTEAERGAKTPEALAWLVAARTNFIASRAWSRHVAGRNAEALVDAREAVARYAEADDIAQQLTAQATVVQAALGLANLELARAEYEKGMALFEVAHARVDVEHGAGLRGKNVEWAGIQEELVSLALRSAGTDAQQIDRALRDGLRDSQMWKTLTLLERWSLRERGAQADAQAVDAAASGGVLRKVACALERVQAALPDDETCLVDYVNGRERAYAYVLTRHSLARIELAPWKTLERDARAFRSAIVEDNSPDSSRVMAELGVALHEQLVAPVFAELAARGLPAPRQLLVVPTPGLALLPFDALLTRALPANTSQLAFADWPFLVRTLYVDQVPSLPLLVKLHELGPRRSSTARTLILAAPHYGRDGFVGRDPAVVPELWPDLKWTIDEARSLAGEIVPRESSAVQDTFAAFLARGTLADTALRGDHVTLCAGRAATKSALFELDDSYAYLFCMTHADADLDQPERAGLVLSFVDGEYEHFRCSDLDQLPHGLDTELVVLSSCSTAVGRAQRAEGVESFAYACLRAGSRGVIASLWPVPDAQALALFSAPHATPAGEMSFHRALVGGTATPSRALNDSKRAVSRARLVPLPGVATATAPAAGTTRGSGAGGAPLHRARRFDPADPYFWAAFVYSGVAR